MKTELFVDELARRRADPATAAEVAAALIALAIKESEQPVEELAGALARMSQELAQCAGQADGLPAPLAERHRRLARELATCVQCLQFHDRLTQQLAQVRNLLASLTIHALQGIPPADPRCWDELLRSLRARFTSDSHRVLFDLLMQASGGALPDGDGEAHRLHASEGSIELF